MAQGSSYLFNEAAKDLISGDTHDWDSHTFKLYLITTVPSVSDTTPTLGDYTEVSPLGTSYGGPTTLVPSLTRSGNTATLDFTSDITYAVDAGGPTNIKAALIVNSSNADIAVGFIDLTTDGSTAISLASAPITLTFNTNGFFQAKV